MKLKYLAVGISIVTLLTGCGSTETSKTLSPEAQISRDSLYWMNGTYGTLIKRNGKELTQLGGFNTKKKLDVAIAVQVLENSWDITDQASAEENIEWLISEGHNAQLIEDFTYNEFGSYTREELAAAFEGNENYALAMSIFDAKTEYGDSAILAWDYSRAIQLLTWSYEAGYYDYEEAMTKALEVANKLQETYTSWDDMMTSYFYGYQYWSEEDLEDESTEAYTRKGIYDELVKEENSPYQLDWKMPLNIDYALANKMEDLR